MLEKPSTKDTQVYNVLRGRILKSRLRPGERLIERDICSSLGVTRTPVRHALRRLEQEGLVVSEPYRGCHVREVALGEVADLFDLREALEGLAARSVALDASPNAIDKLEKAALDTDQAFAVGDWAGYFERDHDFHTLLVESSGNSKLIEVMEVFTFQLRTFALYDRFLLNVVSELQKDKDFQMSRHVRLVEAIKDQGPEAAELAIRLHIRSAKSVVLSVWDDVSAGETKGRKRK